MTQKPKDLTSDPAAEKTEIISNNSEYTAENIDVLRGFNAMFLIKIS